MLNNSRKQSLWRKLSSKQQTVLFICTVVVLIIIAVSTWFVVNIQPVNRNNGEFVEIEIPTGASIQQVATILSTKKLIKNNVTFVILSKVSSIHIEAGTHQISPSMSVPDIIHRLKTASKSTFTITILPETTILDLRELFKKFDFSDAEIETALKKTYSHPLLASKPSDLGLDGYIFPDTYEMHTQDSLEDLINRTFDNLYKKLSSDGSLSLINAKNLTIHDTLTIASIIAKEAPDEEDQKLISGVFWNRLNIDMPLGSDVTFKYAYNMGYCEINSPSCDSVWNTRMHKGMPPGPVSNMKYSTIQATLNPTDSEYFFFVAGDDGTNHFSVTAEEHYQNIANYCTIQCQ
jgi:conserved hypothetical protein, YceG family